MRNLIERNREGSYFISSKNMVWATKLVILIVFILGLNISLSNDRHTRTRSTNKASFVEQ